MQGAAGFGAKFGAKKALEAATRRRRKKDKLLLIDDSQRWSCYIDNVPSWIASWKKPIETGEDKCWSMQMPIKSMLSLKWFWICWKIEFLSTQALMGNWNDKKILREIGKRRNSVECRREDLLNQKGGGLWSGLGDCFQLCFTAWKNVKSVCPISWPSVRSEPTRRQREGAIGSLEKNVSQLVSRTFGLYFGWLVWGLSNETRQHQGRWMYRGLSWMHFPHP